MKERGSALARKIEAENRYEEIMKRKYSKKNRLEEFKEKYCNKCKNKNSNLCNITTTINNQLKCVEFVESE